MKRTDYITWDEYFMGVAKLSGMRSKDPSTQVGACIVSQDNKILSMGYNGFPIGCADDEFPWDKNGGEEDTKYLYVSLFPCNECAKAIIQSGIREIIYECDKYADTPAVRASKRMLDAAGVTYRKYESAGRSVTIDL